MRIYLIISLFLCEVLRKNQFLSFLVALQYSRGFHLLVKFVTIMSRNNKDCVTEPQIEVRHE